MTSAEIGNIGERHVTAWLQSKGYRCHRNTELPGSTDIEADGPARLVVQVKTAVYPNSPANLNDDEQRGIAARANRNQRQAWLAQLVIRDEGTVIGNVFWTRLN